MKFFKKWYTYQKERFPVLMYGIYIFSIVFSTYCFTSWLGRNLFFNGSLMNIVSVNNPSEIKWSTILIMFIVAFLQFLMVRIIDEFKDYEDDCKFRPYRPVPRGLITLKELKVLFIICIIMQMLITVIFCAKAIPFLILVWVFFAIMSKSFFIKKITEKYILLEVLLDEFLMPILVIYLAIFVNGSIEQLFASKFFFLFLFMTYIISWIVEIARKVRCKEDEEKGVKTYTAVFGIKNATILLSTLEIALACIQGIILNKYIISVVCLIFAVILINIGFITKRNRKFAKLTELSANIYIFLVYFSMGLLLI